MSKKKTIVFSVIAIFLVMAAIELLTLGGLYLVGRHNDWGYPSDGSNYSPYIGVFYPPSTDGRDRYGFRLDSNDDSLRDLEKKGILSYTENEISVTTVGRYFVRHICRVFDKFLKDNSKYEIHGN